MLTFSISPNYLFQEELLLRLTFLGASIENACKVSHWDYWESSVQDEALLGVEGLCILGHSIFFGMNLTKLDAIHHDKISAFNKRERERFLKHH